MKEIQFSVLDRECSGKYFTHSTECKTRKKIKTNYRVQVLRYSIVK